MSITKRDMTLIILIVIIGLFSIVFLLTNTVKTLKYRKGNPKDIIYTSSVEDDLQYEVILSDNDYIDNNELDNLSYITSLIEYINISFIYDYQGDRNVPLDYDYFIKANIISNYTEKIKFPTFKPVWNKEFILLDHQKRNTSNSKIAISEKIKMGLKFYNDLVNSFAMNLNLPVDSTLEIKLVVNISGKLENNNNFKKEHYMLMSIPLGVKAFDITTAKNFVNNEIIYSKESLKKETSYMLAIIYICLIIGIVYLGTHLVRKTCDKDKCKFLLEKTRILKEYDDRIVIVRNFINYSNYEMVDIVSFDELINLSNETYEPIIYWERKEKGINEGWYTIIRNRIIYRYVIYKRKKSES